MSKTVISLENLALFKRKADNYYVLKSTKGKPNGFVGLDADGKIETRFLPDQVKKALVKEYENKTLLPAEGDEQVLYLIKDSNEILFYSVAAHAYKQFTIAKPLLDAKISIKGVVEAPKISFDGYHDVELQTEVTSEFPTTSITDIDDLF